MAPQKKIKKEEDEQRGERQLRSRLAKKCEQVTFVANKPSKNVKVKQENPDDDGTKCTMAKNTKKAVPKKYGKQEQLDRELDDDESENITKSSKSSRWPAQDVLNFIDAIEDQVDENDNVPCGRRMALLDWEMIASKVKKPIEACKRECNLLLKGVSRYRTLMEVLRHADLPKVEVVNPFNYYKRKLPTELGNADIEPKKVKSSEMPISKIVNGYINMEQKYFGQFK